MKAKIWRSKYNPLETGWQLVVIIASSDRSGPWRMKVEGEDIGDLVYRVVTHLEAMGYVVTQAKTRPVTEDEVDYDRL